LPKDGNRKYDATLQSLRLAERVHHL